MACTGKLTKDILSNCETQPVGGIEQIVYLINRTDISAITYDGTNKNKITNIALTSPTVAYKLTGTKKALNAGYERVVAEDMEDMFKHKLSFSGYEFDSASVLNIDKAKDLVAIVERKDKTTADGIFVAFGVGTGLFVTSDAMMINESFGTRKIEMSTMDGQLEKYSQYNVLATDYATTKALLDGLLT